MEKQLIKDAFDSSFKFAVGEKVCHKADTKSFSSDMGLLILHRIFIESVDDDGNVTYARSYQCRVVKFSGSGDVINFQEKELMSMAEWNKENAESERERNEMREEVRQTQIDIHRAFGVSKDSRMYLKSIDGNIDKSVEYRISGWSKAEGVVKLNLREVVNLNGQESKAEVTSPDQFELVP